MPAIKSAREIADKWSRVSQTRGQDYAEGVQSPVKDWERSTVAAKDNYKAGVQSAISRGSFEKGVAKAGTDKWQKGALDVGVRRWPEGIAVAQPSFEAGFEPYRETIAKTTLPPRGPKGDPRNFDRVRILGTALHEQKIKS